MGYHSCGVVCLGGWMAMALFVGGGCAAQHPRWSGEAEITSVLTSQQASWNNGDVEAFMEPYLHSEKLSFSSGGRVTRGWDETLAGYRKRYPTPEAMGHLTFSDLEITRLARDAALVLGRWHLERENPIGGAFSLVLSKNRGHWEIIHDHTSRDQP